VLAKQQGLVPAVVPLFHAARGAGLYVHEHLCERLALQEGEAWP
jgi:hypothetical protein